MMERALVVEGPLVPNWGGSVIYSITLSNGFVVTSPAGFGREPIAGGEISRTPIERDSLRSREYFSALRNRIAARHAE